MSLLPCQSKPGKFKYRTAKGKLGCYTKKQIAHYKKMKKRGRTSQSKRYGDLLAENKRLRRFVRLGNEFMQRNGGPYEIAYDEKAKKYYYYNNFTGDVTYSPQKNFACHQYFDAMPSSSKSNKRKKS